MSEFDYRKHIMQSGLTIIGTGTLASAPVASADNLGMLYLETGDPLWPKGRLYSSRRIVYMNGPDTLTFQSLASDLKNINWEFSFEFRDDNSAQDVFARYVQFISGGLPNLVLVANQSGKIDLSFRNDGSTSVHTLSMSSFYNDLKPHKFTFGNRGGLFYAYSDIEAEKTISTPAWNGTGFTSVIVSDHNTSIRPLGVFNIRQSASVLIDCFQCNDAIGTTAIFNSCTPSRPATLSDSTAHTYSWIPIQYSNNVIRSGTLADAPDASVYWNQGGGDFLFYNTDDGFPYVAIRSFHNAGVDYGDWGRPETLIGLMSGKNYLLDVVGRTNGTETFRAFVQLGVTPNVEMSVSTGNLATNRWFSVGITNAPSLGNVPIGTFSRMRLVVTPTTHTAYINETAYAPNTNGPLTTSANIFITGSGTTSNNLDGDVTLINFKNTSGQCVACFNANSPSHWDGGAMAIDSAGNVITFTDAAPLGRTIFSWFKLSDAQAWGILV